MSEKTYITTKALMNWIDASYHSKWATRDELDHLKNSWKLEFMEHGECKKWVRDTLREYRKQKEEKL